MELRRFRAAAWLLAAAGVFAGCARAGATTAPGPGERLGGDLPGPRSVDVTLDRAHSISRRVSASRGGLLTATGADGSRFSLDIPPGALLTDTTITLTPIAALERLPFTGGSVAAAQFGPDGLRLFVPARLTIAPARAIPLAEQVGFAFHMSGADLFLTPLAADPARIQLLIEHFGGGGIAAASPCEVAAQLREYHPASPESRLQQQIAQAVQQARISRASPAQLRASLSPIFQAYYQAVVVPAIAAVLADPSRTGEFAVAFGWLGEVRFWSLAPTFAAQQRSILRQFQIAISATAAQSAARCPLRYDTMTSRTIEGLIRTARLYGFRPSPELSALVTSRAAQFRAAQAAVVNAIAPRRALCHLAGRSAT